MFWWTSYLHGHPIRTHPPPPSLLGEVRLDKLFNVGKPSQLNEGSQPCKIQASDPVTVGAVRKVHLIHIIT